MVTLAGSESSTKTQQNRKAGPSACLFRELEEGVMQKMGQSVRGTQCKTEDEKPRSPASHTQTVAHREKTR